MPEVIDEKNYVNVCRAFMGAKTVPRNIDWNVPDTSDKEVRVERCKVCGRSVNAHEPHCPRDLTAEAEREGTKE